MDRPEWRPDDWKDTKANTHQQFGMMRTAFDSMSYEAGASAMLAALLKYLDEPCTEHPLERKDIITGCYKYREHRYLCRQCLSELKESVK